ncbi:MAG: hypothetical protein N3C12_08365 [Candidatus Binatia bacterium]|nr:hypothetical protein [Candidatus Binatia bacterium]
MYQAGDVPVDGFPVFAVAAYIAMAAWPLIVFFGSDRERKVYGLLACTVALGASLWRFGQTPPGVCCMDTNENMLIFYNTGRFHWSFLFLESRAPMGQGFDFLPVYVFNRVFRNFYGERVVGLIFHLLIVLGASALLPRRGLLTGLALIACAPSLLWASRHMQGAPLLLGKLGLIGCLQVLRERWNWKAALGALGCLSYLSWGYLPMRITYVFPVLWLWQRPRALLMIYLLFSVPLFLTLVALRKYVQQPVEWRLLPRHLTTGSYRIPALGDVSLSLRSLVDPRGGVKTTASHEGVQALPLTAVPFVLWGAMKGPFGIAALAATTPDIFSEGAAGRSHRMMVNVLPLAFAAAQAPSHPVLGLLVAAEGIGRWVWISLYTRPLLWCWHNGYVGLNPCEHVEPRPVYCR